MAWIYKQKKDGPFWIGWRVGGKQFLKSTGTDDRKKAEGHLHDLEAMLQRSTDGRLTDEFVDSVRVNPLPKVSLRAAITEWLAEAGATTAEASAVRYRQIADSFLEFLQATESTPLLRDVQTEHVRAFLANRLQVVSPRTVNLYRKVLSGFFIRELKNQPPRIRENPCLPIKGAKEGRRETSGRRALTPAEVQLIYTKAPSDFWRFMIVAGFFTGARLGDLATLKWGNIDASQNLIRFTDIKTGKAIKIPIAAGLARVLRTMERGPHAAFLWPEQAAIYEKQGPGPLSMQFYEDVLTPAGLAERRTHKKRKGDSRRTAGLSFHCLRHSFVTELQRAGASKNVAKELVGHSSDSVNDIYTHTAPDLLATAVAQLPAIEI